MKHWVGYIMSNKPNGVIYIGVTDNIDERVKEHKLKVFTKSFTVKYNCHKLKSINKIPAFAGRKFN